MPAVSVVLPTFNRLRFLRPAIESVLAQTFEDWELIIADDGSNEDTKAFLRDLPDPRIKVIWLAHTGNPGAVRNAALREAAGSYVAFLDSDDLWFPEKLQIQLATLTSAGRRRCGYGGYTCIDDSGQPRACPGRKPWRPLEGAIFEQILRYEADIVTATVMVERELLVALGGFDTAQAVQEDYDLWMRLAIAGEIGVIERPLVAMRIHDEHYGKGGVHALLNRQMSLTKVRRLLAGSRWLGPLDEALAENVLRLALAYAGTDRRASLRTLQSGWPALKHGRRSWLLLAKVGLKLSMPRWALALRRRRRLS